MTEPSAAHSVKYKNTNDKLSRHSDCIAQADAFLFVCLLFKQYLQYYPEAKVGVKGV